MIHLLQPPPARDMISGGYRYQAEIARRLLSTQLGSLLEIAPRHLATPPPEASEDDAIFVFDSLYIASQLPPPWMGAPGRSLTTRLLLHFLPSQNPALSDEERAALAVREGAWIAAVDGVLATSTRTAAAVGRLYDRTARVASPGVSPCFRPRAVHAPDETSLVPTVLMVGSLTSTKGQREVARLLAELATPAQPARLVLVGDAGGDPAYAAEVHHAAASPSLAFEVTGCLAPEEVADRLREASIFVSASTFESYGMAVSEAVATGVPVLTYDVGEVDRWVREGENGYLLAPGDTAGLRERLAELLTDPRRRHDLCTGSAKQFFPSWEYTFERFLTACRSPRATSEAAGVPGASEDHEPRPTFYSRCELPTGLGTFDVRVYRQADGEEAILIRMGDLDTPEAPFVRVHSECFTGEILHSLKCDCKMQLDIALRTIAERGHGAVVYLRQEGRGIGLGNKIRAYAEQAKGADTVEANERLGFPADMRDFRTAAAILRQNGVHRVQLNTNNPNKVTSLEANGIAVEKVIPSATDPNPHNLEYLLTKYHLLGHDGLEHALHGAGMNPDAGEAPGRPAPVSGPADAEHTLVLMDLDGVIHVDGSVPRGAQELLRQLREGGFAIRFLTNDGINSRASRREELARCGLEVDVDELYTASYLTARYVKERAGGPILPLCGHPALDEFEGIPRATTDARTVVVGDYFPHYDYGVVKAAYAALERGAELVAMHRKRSWPTGGARVIDLGFWVAGLEFCSRRPATVIGKPSEYSYATVLRDTGFPPERVVMISDEVDPDLMGARRWGIRTVHFDDGGAQPPIKIAGRTVAPSYGEVWEALRIPAP